MAPPKREWVGWLSEAGTLASMNYELVFRSRYGWLTALTVGLLGVVFVAMIWSAEGPAAGLPALVLPIALSYITWWLWAYPCVIANSGGVTVRNQVRTTFIGWEAFGEAESDYGLYIQTNVVPTSRKDPAGETSLEAAGTELLGRRVFCAGVPAKGGFTAGRQKPPTEPVQLYFEPGPKITLRTTPSEAAALLNAEASFEQGEERRDPTRHASPRQVEGWESRGALKKFLHGTPKNPEKLVGVSSRTNWLSIAALVLLTAAAVLYGVSM